MNKKKILLVVGVVIAILLIVGTFFITKQQYYEKGKIEQSEIMINILLSFALNCQPIDIPSDEGVIQLVNPKCF